MQSMNIIEILKSPEGKSLEFKREFPSSVSLAKTAIAFANTSGGKIMVGIEDGTRRIVGVDNPLEIEEKLCSIITDLVTPQILPEIEILSYKNMQVVAIQIYPSPLKPHYLKAKGPSNGAYVRIGSTNRVADDRFIAEIQRSVLNQSYDEQPFLDESVDNIDTDKLLNLYEPIKKINQRDLITLRLVTEYHGKVVPTFGGIILFGKNRLDYFPDAWFKVGRFNGKTKEKIIDTLDIKSYPVIAVEEAINFVKKHAMVGIEIDTAKHQEKWNIPMEAIREAIINAVVHADYSQSGSLIRVSIFQDRIEIENPGLLPFGISLNDIKYGVSKLRNRAIGRIFRDLKLIEQWGSGIQRILSVCKELKLKEPIFEEIGTNFRVTIYIIPDSKPDIDETDQKILALLRKQDGLSTSYISSAINLSPRSTRTRLSNLVRKGFIVDVGVSKNDPTKSYFLKDNCN